MERKWWTLLAGCIAIFMLLVDVTIVNVALPSIERDLGADFSDLQWVIDAYALTLAGFVLAAGSLADKVGRKRVFMFGLAIFTASSLACGLAPDPLFLNVSRAAQGIGAFAPFTCEVTECSIDLRVGGNYHIVFVTEDGTECSFRGTYLEVEPPTRTVATWLFEGWPDADAVESVDLHETDGVTKLTMRLAFRDQAGRDHMTKSDGQEDSFNKMEDYLRSLLEQKETVSA